MRSAALLACAFLYGCAAVSDPLPLAQRTNCPIQNLWAQSNSPWLQTNPRIHLVFWGSYWLGNWEANYYASEWNTLANDPNFYKPLQEYGIQTGTLEGIYYTNLDIVAESITDSDIQKELAAEIANGQLPAPDRQSMYVLMFPPNTPLGYCNPDNPWCIAYHGSINDAYTYQAINYQSDPLNNKIGSSVSHEIYESATDADGSGYWTGNGETEVGDYCDGSTYSLNGYTIQQVWSQDACQCIPTTGN